MSNPDISFKSLNLTHVLPFKNVLNKGPKSSRVCLINELSGWFKGLLKWLILVLHGIEKKPLIKTAHSQADNYTSSASNVTS